MEHKIKESAYLEADQIIQPIFENLEVTLYCTNQCLDSKTLHLEGLNPEESHCLSNLIRGLRR